MRPLSRARRAVSAFLLLGLVALAGCSGSGDRAKVVKAGGRVTYQGQPVEGAVVTFTNEPTNTSAYARTGPDGRFLLTTFGHEDGAVPGSQKVAVTKTVTIEKAKPANVDYSASSAIPPPPEVKHQLPTKYGSPATSGIEVEVKVGEENDFALDLR